MQRQFSKEHSNIVKGVGILLLLFYHLFNNEFVNINMKVDYRPFSSDIFLKFACFGNICVATFVFITTFGICTGLFSQKDISAEKAFGQATKRFFRLMFHFSLLYISANLLWWYKLDYQSVYGIGKQGLLKLLIDALGFAPLLDSPMLNVSWWYMEIAYLLIFIVPVLALCTKKIGYPIVFLIFTVTSLFQVNDTILRYLPTMVLAVCAAYGKWLDKLMNLKLPLVLQWIIGCVGMVSCVFIRQYKFIWENYLAITDAFVVLVIVFFAGVLLSSVPVLKDILQFIGKHSMNIYLIHTFFYLMLWQKFVYSFKYAGLILLVLLGLSLLYSVLLELLKTLLFKACRKLKLHR